MKLAVLATMAAAALAAVTSMHRSKKIIHGANASIEQFPYQVSVQYPFASAGYRLTHTCGGVIIAPDQILTAAHCIFDKGESLDETEFRVRAGSTSWFSGGQLVRVIGITTNPDFHPPSYDVAVLKLAHNLTMGRTVAAADLAGARDRLPDKESDLVVAGWGQTRAAKGPLAHQLRSMKPKVVRRWNCQAKYLPYGGIGNHNFCAGDWEGGENTWVGDSGGGLYDVKHNKIVGIVSFGFDAPALGPTVYTGVPGVRDFISDVAGI